MGKQWKLCQTIFGGSKITADGDCSHEIKRHLLLGRKVMTNLDSIFKSRDITLPTKIRLVQAMVFPVVMYGCESWTIKKAVQFNCSVMSNPLRPHEPQLARPPYPSPTAEVYPNPCPLSWWCYPTISCSVIPFSSCLQSLPASGAFPMSQLFASCGQRPKELQLHISPSNEYSGLISFRID